MFFACRVRLVFRDKSERTATKDHGGVAAIALCPDTLRGSCSGRESAIKLFQTAVSCRPSRHSPCCERLLTLPLLSMSWSILLKVWPLFRCSCMAAFGCSLRSNQRSCTDENWHTNNTFSFDRLSNAYPNVGSTIGRRRKLYGRPIPHSPSISRTLYVVIVRRIIWGISSQDGISRFRSDPRAPRTM